MLHLLQSFAIVGFWSKRQARLRRPRRAALLLAGLGLLWMAPSSSAQAPYHIDTWQTDQGLPHSTVTCLAQTADGYLWLGTHNGLVRFDGLRFKVFDENNTPAIKNSRIVQLFEDTEQSLWIGTEQGGLVRLQHGHFSSYELPSKGTTHNYVREFCQDRQGALWLVTCEWQLIRFFQGQFSVASSGWSLKGRNPAALAADARGDICVGTENELAVGHEGAFRGIGASAGATPRRVEFLAPSRDGGCWVAGEGRLSKLLNDQEIDFAPYAWTNRPVYDLYEDTQGRLWAATLGSGLFSYDRHGQVTQLKTRDGLPTDFVRCVTEDREGNIWVGTEDGGVCRLKTALFQTYGVRQGLASSQVMSMAEPDEDGLWIGTNGDGLDRLHDGKVQHYGLAEGLKNGHAWSVLRDRQKALWVGTWDGLFKGNTNGFVSMSDGIAVRWQVLALYEDRSGAVWVGQQAFAGITRLQGTEREVINIPGASASLDVRALQEDGEGSLWIGTNGDGLYRYRAGHFTRFGKADGLGSETIWCLHVDAEGVLWVGTCRGGLSRWDGRAFTTWTTRNGLVNNVICQILEDDLGNLWLGSYGGVFRVNKERLRQSPTSANMEIQCVRYGKDDGLPSIECQGGFQPSGCKSRDGRLWFPTVKGLAVVDPRKVPQNGKLTPVILEELLVDGTPIPQETLAGSSAPATTPMSAPGARRPLRIGPGRQRLEFHYTGLSLAAPDAVRYRYKLEGLEPDWVEAGDARVANYSHVPAGEYRFRIIACNNEGDWNQTGASLSLVVLPYFWHTRWFLGLTLLGALGGAAGSARYMEGRKLRRQLDIAEREKAVERERARIAQDMHDDLGANLTSIAILSELAQNPAATREEIHADVRTITVKARELTKSLDEIVWAVNPQDDTLDSFVTYACNFAEEYLRLAKIACRLEIPEQLPEAVLTTDLRHNLFLVIKEAVNNVVKHAGAREVWLRVAAPPDGLQISIQDDGKGFEMTGVERGARRNGLANMRKRMESIGGRIEFITQPEQGVCVRLSLCVGPCGRPTSIVPSEAAG